LKKYKETKKLYSRKYREENPEKVSAYLKKTVKERASRNKARKIMGAKKGEVHHKDGNPRNNSKSNLVVARKNHGGGRKRQSTRALGSKKKN
jgi:hypothetical protein